MFMLFIFIYLIFTLVNLVLLKYSRKQEYFNKEDAEVFFWISIIPLLNFGIFGMLVYYTIYKIILKSKLYKIIINFKDFIIK